MRYDAKLDFVVVSARIYTLYQQTRSLFLIRLILTENGKDKLTK